MFEGRKEENILYPFPIISVRILLMHSVVDDRSLVNGVG